MIYYILRGAFGTFDFKSLLIFSSNPGTPKEHNILHRIRSTLISGVCLALDVFEEWVFIAIFTHHLFRVLVWVLFVLNSIKACCFCFLDQKLLLRLLQVSPIILLFDQWAIFSKETTYFLSRRPFDINSRVHIYLHRGTTRLQANYNWINRHS
jgi:hypothetical protein